MKRHGHLWEQLVSFENLLLAYRKARRGKRSQNAVERFEYHRELELARLRQQLIDGTVVASSQTGDQPNLRRSPVSGTSGLATTNLVLQIQHPSRSSPIPTLSAGLLCR